MILGQVGALAWYTVKASFTGRRLVGLGLLSLVPAGFSFVLAWLWGSPTEAEVSVFLLLMGVGLVVPLLALVVSVGALRDDLSSGSIVHVVTKPVRREVIVATRIATAALITYAAALVALSLPFLVAGSTMVDAWWVGVRVSFVASVAYASFFAFLGVVVNRAALVGLVYLVAWETVVAMSPFFFRFWTIAYWVRSLMVQDASVSPALEAQLLFTEPASTMDSLLVLAGLVLVLTVAGMAWFARREFAGPEPEA